VSVDEVAPLVVEDSGGSESALLQETRSGEDEGGLASAEKSADYREDGFAIRDQDGTLICQNNDLIVADGGERASRTEPRKRKADATLLPIVRFKRNISIYSREL